MNNESKLVSRPAFQLMGLEIRTTNALEMNPATAQISSVWQCFYAGNVGAAILNRTNPQHLLGVYTHYASDHAGEYSMLVAAEVNAATHQPDLTHLHVPAATYLVFSASGAMPQIVIETWQRVWAYFTPNAKYKRTYTVDFELYDTARADVIEIYIAVRD